MQALKLVAIGDPESGKTCLLMSLTAQAFLAEYTPTVFDNYVVNVDLGSRQINVGLWDTAGCADFDRLRPLSYPQTDAFLLCVSLAAPQTLATARDRWLPELRRYCPQAPVFLVGTKLDLREEAAASAGAGDDVTVSQAEGRRLADEIGAVAYVECSAKRVRQLRQQLTQIVETTVGLTAAAAAAEAAAAASAAEAAMATDASTDAGCATCRAPSH